MGEALGQSGHLYVEYLVAVRIQLVAARHEGQGRVGAAECTLLFGDGVGMHVCGLGEEVGLCGSEGGVATALHAQFVEVYLRAYQLGIEAETLPLCYHRAVFGDEGIARKHEVGGRLSIAAAAVYVSCHAAGRLLGDERAQVFVLARHLVRCREVEDNLRTLQGQCRAGRCHTPQVLTYLHAKGIASRVEYLVRTYVHLLSGIQNVVLHAQVVACAEPSALVKLAVVGDIAFGHDT